MAYQAPWRVEAMHRRMTRIRQRTNPDPKLATDRLRILAHDATVPLSTLCLQEAIAGSDDHEEKHHGHAY